MPIYHDGKKMKPYRGYRKPVNVYYGDKKVAGWKNSTQTGNNLTFQTTYNDTADVVVKGKTLQKSEWVHKQGLTTQDSFAVNDEITVPYRGYNLTFRIVHINGELLTLEMKNVFSSSSAYKSIQFDGAEALYFAEEGLAAGTYNFTLLAGYDVAYGGGKTYQFTLAQDVPAGGCLMFPWGSQVQADTVKISSYASLTATTAIESVSVIEGSDGISLGVADGNTENMNHTHRIRYGSNNYAQSAIRQWLNSSASLGSVWTPQTKFDRPPTYHTSSDPAYAGFMNGLDPDFLAVVEAAVIPYRTNGVFEVNSLDGTEFAINQTYNLTDKFFLLSRPEIYGTWDSASYKDGELLEFYDGLTDTERIKYDAFGDARNAWLRSPFPSYAFNARFVSTDGSLYGSYANSAYGAAAACNVKISNLQTLIDTGTISYTHANPSPLYPQPFVSNLPAGTYKTQDWKGDWWEFTLTEDLCGIGEVRDAVEWDRYNPSVGRLDKRCGENVLDGVSVGKRISVVTTYAGYLYAYYLQNDAQWGGGVISTHFIRQQNTIYPGIIYKDRYNDAVVMTHTDQTLDTVTKWNTWLASEYASGNPLTVIYQLATPTRTALTFTLNNASTAPECPMEFLTDTPSLEYPAEVFDASGEVKVENADGSKFVTAPIEILRSNADGTVYDEQNVTTGVVIRRMSEWANITGANTLTKADSTLLAYKVFKMSLGDLPIPATATTNITAQKYDSTLLTAVNASPTSADRIYTDGSYFYLSAAMADTGFSEACLPSDDEIKAYFYGYRMTHSDGRSPFYKSEVPYNPTTWAEWAVRTNNVTVDSTGATLTANGANVQAIAATHRSFKASTKYGIIYNTVNNTSTSLHIDLNEWIFNTTPITPVTGNNKHILTSKVTVPAAGTYTNGFYFGQNTQTAGNVFKFKDFRIFELPTGSQIEADFTNLTADELAIKYPFDGLNVKHWKKLVGTEAEIQASITSTLPTASYEGFTPYKMIYELSEPIEEQHDPVTLPTYYPTTVITTTNDTPAELTTTATVKVEDD